MKKIYESIDWDSKYGRLIITRQEALDVNEAASIKDAKEKLQLRLESIVRQVKQLKWEAENIKSILSKLEGKAGPTGPAPCSQQQHHNQHQHAEFSHKHTSFRKG
jgi:type IV secretory pathway VirJ component